MSFLLLLVFVKAYAKKLKRGLMLAIKARIHPGNL